MNVLDSELVEGQLRALGYQFVSKPDAADIVLYNTCSVRQKSEDKVLSRLGLMGIRKESEPNLVVGVIGCMAERDGTALLKRMPQVDILCGPGELDRLPTLLENVYKTGQQQSALAGNQSRRSAVTADLEEDFLRDTSAHSSDRLLRRMPASGGMLSRVPACFTGGRWIRCIVWPPGGI